MVRSAKIAAIKAQDFEKAAILRDQEKELTAQKEAADKEPKPPADIVSVVDDVGRLRWAGDAPAGPAAQARDRSRRAGRIRGIARPPARS